MRSILKGIRHDRPTSSVHRLDRLCPDSHPYHCPPSAPTPARKARDKTMNDKPLRKLEDHEIEAVVNQMVDISHPKSPKMTLKDYARRIAKAILVELNKELGAESKAEAKGPSIQPGENYSMRTYLNLLNKDIKELYEEVAAIKAALGGDTK